VTKRIYEADDAAYTVIEVAIRSGELSPNQRLVEQELIERYGLSRAAIRVALVRLEQDGVVVRERNRGARVRSVSVAEAVEILQVRAALDGLAARHAAMRAADADIEELRRLGDEMAAAYEDGDIVAMGAANARIDRLIVELSAHGTLQQLSASLNSHMVRFRFSAGVIAGRPDVSLAEHRAIIEAIASRDPDAAEQAMRSHFDNVARALQRRLEGAPTVAT
jgi:DNA-binding GntR family transcriptional regulator